MNLDKYVIITAARNEEAYIEQIIKSVISQTIQPVEWIIVNDGSTDNTGRIINQYAQQYPWIRAVHRGNRGFREAGGGVIEAFYDGYNSLESKEWDYIVKLDGDLSLEHDYFEKCFEHFSRNLILGIGGGTIYCFRDGMEKPEKNPVFHVRGATKIYRKECWDSIDGLIKAPGWDTLDEVKANMLGWETRSFGDLKVLQHRPTGQAEGVWRDSIKNGMANYISGYHPVFMFLKFLRRMFIKPYLIGSVGLLYGFVSGYFKKIPQVNDRDLITYLRKQQINRLFLRSSIWK